MTAVTRSSLLARAAPAGPSSPPGCRTLLGADLAVIANTADDIEIHGVHVSPDPDLVTYWLAGEIDEERGWGIRDDTFTVFERLEQLGAPGWFGSPTATSPPASTARHFIAEGGTPHRRPGPDRPRRSASRARVLPMCEQPVRTAGADRRRAGAACRSS